MSKRVVVTGVSGVTSLGNSADQIIGNLKENRSAVQVMPEWERFKGLNSKLGAPVVDFETPSHYNRKQLRSMGPIAKMATVATEQALVNSGIRDESVLTSGQTGVAYGSCAGSTMQVLAFMNMFHENTTRGINANTYLKMMSHTCAVNIAIFFGIKGRLIPTSTACTSGSQAVGYAYESIKEGRQVAMVAGGAEELCPSEVAVFDTLFATSVKNDTPTKTPAPFDKNRDGLVLGEGATTFVLEELEHAKARGANILCEVVGFATNCDAQHITQPNQETMKIAMKMALDDANVSPSDIGYVNAHGTGTTWGDVAESHATMSVFGDSTPVSSLKGHYGHTLGACGALESWLSIEMMNRNWFTPTLNLSETDDQCANLNFIKHEGNTAETSFVVNNNFAFGGVNTSLVFKRWE